MSKCDNFQFMCKTVTIFCCENIDSLDLCEYWQYQWQNWNEGLHVHGVCLMFKKHLKPACRYLNAGHSAYACIIMYMQNYCMPVFRRSLGALLHFSKGMLVNEYKCKRDWLWSVYAFKFCFVHFFFFFPIPTLPFISLLDEYGVQ